MSDAYIGEIRLFAGDFAPIGWALCDGSLLSIAQYDVVFSLLGTTYGGDGVNTFALPDLRGRLPIGAGQGQGLSNRVIGEQIGVENVSLIASNTPAHTHAFKVGGAASNTSPEGQVPGTVAGFNAYTASNTAPQALNADTVQASGGGAPHDNVMPSLALTHIICLEGIYPNFN